MLVLFVINAVSHRPPYGQGQRDSLAKYRLPRVRWLEASHVFASLKRLALRGVETHCRFTAKGARPCLLSHANTPPEKVDAQRATP